MDSESQGEVQIFEQISELECAGIILNYQIVTPKIVEKAHQMSLFVMVYTANEPLLIEQLLQIGVDSIITDNMEINLKR